MSRIRISLLDAPCYVLFLKTTTVGPIHLLVVENKSTLRARETVLGSRKEKKIQKSGFQSKLITTDLG